MNFDVATGYGMRYVTAVNIHQIAQKLRVVMVRGYSADGYNVPHPTATSKFISLI